jgi:hypothetical protein
LKAQSTTPSASTAPPIAEPIVSVTNGGGGIGGGFLSAVSARKEREKGAQVMPAEIPFLFVRPVVKPLRFHPMVNKIKSKRQILKRMRWDEL